MFNADVPMSDIDTCLKEIEDQFDKEDFAFHIYKIGGGYQFLTNFEIISGTLANACSIFFISLPPAKAI